MLISENRQVPALKQTPNRNWLTDIAFLALLLLFFYFAWLGSYPFFTPDEGRYSEVAREMIASHDYITPRVNGVAFLDKPVLYYWLQAIAIFLFGVNEWAIRLFPALLGIVGCIATYIGGRALFDRRTGWLSALILATTPLYFGGAHYADLNLEVAVFITCTLIAFIIGVTRKDKYRHYFLYAAYIFAALAFLTKGMIGIAFPSMIAGAWILILWRWNVLKQIHLPTGLILFTLLVLPWYVLVQKANPEFLHYFFVTQQVTRFLSAEEFNNKTPFWFYAPIILVGFFPWTIFLFQSLTQHVKNIWQKRQAYSSELFLLLWFAIVFVFFSIPNSKTVGYIFPVFPALALLVGSYLSSVWKTMTVKNIRLTTLAFISLNILLAGLLIALTRNDWLPISIKFSPYLRLTAAIFLAAAICSIWVLIRKKLGPLFLLCLATSVLCLLTLMSGASKINHDSAKPLVMLLKKVVKPEDEVVSYFRFFQDVPLYLGQRITIVADWSAATVASKDNWQRELWYGMAFQQTDSWLINEDVFWQRWNSPKRMFVFVSTNYFDQFKAHASSYFLLGKYNRLILLSNQPTFLIPMDSDLSEHP